MPSRRQYLTALASVGLGTTSGCSSAEGPASTTTGTTATSSRPTTTESATTDPTDTPEPTTTYDGTDFRLFDGGKRVFVVNGYSTSRYWPELLQRKLNRYETGERRLWVRSAIEAGAPIARWIDPDTGEPTATWQETLASALERSIPVVLLAQQSLQWAFGDRSEGIEDESDTAAIERGANVIERYVRRAMADGADAVYVATHIYKHPLEPVIGNERLALDAVLERDIPGLRRGPDVWAPTKAHYPAVYSDDGVHPNWVGAELLAHLWFARLLERENRDVPEWSRAEFEDALEQVTE